MNRFFLIFIVMLCLPNFALAEVADTAADFFSADPGRVPGAGGGDASRRRPG